MKLIADSGSTGTDWVIIESEQSKHTFKTKGLNPYFTTSKEIITELENNFPQDIKPSPITSIYFYGAGCSLNDNKNIISDALRIFFANSQIEINTDLLGAARALFMNNKGIAVILGTGANTGLYDGKNIIHNIPSLGYVLGDEGGGDYLGKLFITDLLYGNIPHAIKQDFDEKFNLTNHEIMQKIYKEPNPNTFLASFCKFIANHKKDSFVNKLIIKSFSGLFEKHIVKYKNYNKHNIGIIGSIGFYFKDELIQVAKMYNVEISTIEKNPIQKLVQYHS